MPFAEGEMVGPYRITDRLGQGGMATVFRAYHPNLDRYVAIKVLHNSFKEDPTFLARFQREAQIVAKLEHPNIVPIYDYNEHNGEPYLVMKFIEGDTLKAVLQQQPLTLEEALSTMTAVGQALTYAHERGVLHRDVKPSNILIDKTRTPYLADFGLARMASAGESTLSQDMMLGTPQYISPEQAQGIQDLDGTTDIYSLGVVLYELVVGRVPFNADTPYAIVHDHIYSPLPLPTKVNPQVPAPVERVLLKALAKDRADRYTSAVQMVEAFRDAVRESNMKELTAGKYRVPVGALPFDASGSSGKTPAVPGIPSPMPPAAATQRTPQRRQSNSGLMLGIGAVIVVGIAALLFVLSRNSNKGSVVLPTVAQLGTELPAFAQLTPPGSATAVAVAASPTVAATSSPTTKPTLKPVEIATEEVGPATATTDASNATDAATPGQLDTSVVVAPPEISPDIKPFPPTPSGEIQRQLNAHPDDPRLHFALAVAIVHERRPLQQAKALAEFQLGMNMTQNNPSLAFEIAQELDATPDIGALPAFEYAVAFQSSGDNHPTIRAQSGRYLFRFAQNAKRWDKNVMDRWNEYVLSTQSAGLYAFAALAAHNRGQEPQSSKAMDKAVSLDADMAEVHLIRGILDAAQDDATDALKEYAAAIKATNAPDWVISAAKTLQQKG